MFETLVSSDPVFWPFFILTILIVLAALAISVYMFMDGSPGLGIYSLLVGVFAGVSSYFYLLEDYVTSFSMDNEVDSISEEETPYYVLNPDELDSVIRENYDLSNVDFQNFKDYSEEDSVYVVDGNAQFEDRMVEFSVSVNIDSEIQLAPYSTDYSEEDLLISQ